MKKKISKKLISVILAVVMLAMSMPVAFAAEPISLTASNVVTYPTVKGTIYNGQVIGEALTLEGGEVQYNGAKVDGEFQFLDPTKRQIAVGSRVRADIVFVPTNENEYTGFSETRSRNATFAALKATPVLVDENNPPIVEGEVKAGVTLSSLKITGGQVMNPYYAEETNALNATWQWRNPTTVVNESGIYEAFIIPNNYEALIYQIQVNVESPIEATEVQTLPTVETLTYNPEAKWSSVELKGGTVVAKGTETVVEGSFAVTDLWNNVTPKAGTYEIDVLFTPSDTEKYTTVEMKIPVTVNKGIVKFVDEDGNEIVPEITLDRVLKVGDDLNGYLKPYLNASCSFNWEETEGYGEKIKPGTHEYTVKTIIDNSNFERYGTLTFKVIANREKINAKVKNVVGGRQIYFEGGDVIQLYGDFDIKCFVDGKETQVIEGVKLNEAFSVNQSKSGFYTYEIIYNAAENDYYDVTVVTEAEEIKLQHSVKINDNEPVVYTYGDMVTITAPAHEKPYYEFTGWSDISGITLTDDQRSAESISTTMPDNDIELKANYKFSLKLFFEWIWAKVVQFFTFIFNAIRDLFALAA